MNPEILSEIPAPDSVRPLQAEDTPAFETLCESDPLRLLSLRLNLDAFGLNHQFVRFWGAFAGQEMRGVLMRIGNTAVVVDRFGECGPAFAALIDSETGIVGARGTVETLRTMQARLKRYTPTEWENSTFMQLRRPPSIAPELLERVRPARPADLTSLSLLYSNAGTMYRSRENVQAKLEETRVFVVEEPFPTRIVSCALLNAEGKEAGLIGGVFTLPLSRGRGYAAACTAAISIDLQRDGKLPCLFYENPSAGRVYRRLGFEDAGDWAVLFLQMHRPSIRP